MCKKGNRQKSCPPEFADPNVFGALPPSDFERASNTVSSVEPAKAFLDGMVDQKKEWGKQEMAKRFQWPRQLRLRLQDPGWKEKEAETKTPKDMAQARADSPIT